MPLSKAYKPRIHGMSGKNNIDETIWGLSTIFKKNLPILYLFHLFIG